MATELTIAVDDRQALVCSYRARSWNVVCLAHPCKVKILGYITSDQANLGALHHLVWHRNGEPRCQDCGREMRSKGAKRCRRGECAEVD